MAGDNEKSSMDPNVERLLKNLRKGNIHTKSTREPEDMEQGDPLKVAAIKAKIELEAAQIKFNDFIKKWSDAGIKNVAQYTTDHLKDYPNPNIKGLYEGIKSVIYDEIIQKLEGAKTLTKDTAFLKEIDDKINKYLRQSTETLLDLSDAAVVKEIMEDVKKCEVIAQIKELIKDEYSLGDLNTLSLDEVIEKLETLKIEELKKQELIKLECINSIIASVSGKIGNAHNVIENSTEYQKNDEKAVKELKELQALAEGIQSIYDELSKAADDMSKATPDDIIKKLESFEQQVNIKAKAIVEDFGKGVTNSLETISNEIEGTLENVIQTLGKEGCDELTTVKGLITSLDSKNNKSFDHPTLPGFVSRGTNTPPF